MLFGGWQVSNWKSSSNRSETCPPQARSHRLSFSCSPTTEPCTMGRAQDSADDKPHPKLVKVKIRACSTTSGTNRKKQPNRGRTRSKQKQKIADISADPNILHLLNTFHCGATWILTSDQNRPQRILLQLNRNWISHYPLRIGVGGVIKSSRKIFWQTPRQHCQVAQRLPVNKRRIHPQDTFDRTNQNTLPVISSHTHDLGTIKSLANAYFTAKMQSLYTDVSELESLSVTHHGHVGSVVKVVNAWECVSECRHFWNLSKAPASFLTPTVRRKDYYIVSVCFWVFSAFFNVKFPVPLMAAIPSSVRGSLVSLYTYIVYLQWHVLHNRCHHRRICRQ